MKRSSAPIIIAAVCAVLCAVFAACGPRHVPADQIIDIGEADKPAVANVGKISISEVMADNAEFVFGCVDDWVELYNDGDEEVSLDSWKLAKKESGKSAVKLDGMKIGAKDYLVVRLPESAAFHLSKNGDTLSLICGQTVADQLTFDASIGCGSWCHEGCCEYPTPGFPNTASGYEAYLKTIKLPALSINEVVSSNSKYAPVDGKFYDFVEVYNGSGKALDLSEYWLSDKRSEPKRYRFPSVTLEAGGYYLVYCSGLAGEDHAPFKIGSTGETLYLSDSTGFIDCVRVPGDLPKDESYGRNGSALVYMTEVTPGGPNANGHSAGISAPTANFASGAYDAPISVELSGGGTIYYTLDGTEPTSSSKVYSGPITVDHIASIRAFREENGRKSALTSFFYLVNIEHAYPVLNVAIKSEYLTGSEGVLNHIDPEYEHEAFITLMDNGVECFSVPCGFKLHGNDSKKGVKQNFQLRFRAKYGMSKLEYKVFENRDITTFNSLLLKGGSEDCTFCGFRDELCTGLVDGTTNLEVQAYRPVILYLNGEYWGIYWLRERIDAEYCAQRLGVSADSINLLKDYGEAVVDGSKKDYDDLIAYCKNHDLRNDADYEWVISKIDYVSMMDWYICRSYMGDTDLANVRFFSSSESDGKWRWCFFDLDWAFWNNTEDPIGKTARDDGNHVIMVSLLKNSRFRDAYLKRTAKLMSTVLNERTIIAAVDRFVELMRPEIERDRTRFGFTVASWESAVNKLKEYVRDGQRDATYLAGIQKYFGLSYDQMISYFGRTR